MTEQEQVKEAFRVLTTLQEAEKAVTHRIAELEHQLQEQTRIRLAEIEAHAETSRQLEIGIALHQVTKRQLAEANRLLVEERARLDKLEALLLAGYEPVTDTESESPIFFLQNPDDESLPIYRGDGTLREAIDKARKEQL